jgi:hypothetical protein
MQETINWILLGKDEGCDDKAENGRDNGNYGYREPYCEIKFGNIVDEEWWHNPKLFDKLNCESKGENNGRIRSWGTFSDLQHFGGRGACWGFGMGTRVNDKWVNYSQRFAQTKQQVG